MLSSLFGFFARPSRQMMKLDKAGHLKMVFPKSRTFTHFIVLLVYFESHISNVPKYRIGRSRTQKGQFTGTFFRESRHYYSNTENLFTYVLSGHTFELYCRTDLSAAIRIELLINNRTIHQRYKCLKLMNVNQVFCTLEDASSDA